MPTYDEVIETVNELTRIINEVTNNSKNIAQLDTQIPIEDDSEIPVSLLGVDKKVTVKQITDKVSGALSAQVIASYPVLIPFDFPLNTKTALDSLHGSLLINNSEDGIILNSTTPISGDGGISKVMGVVLAGTVLTGSYTITGTSIDRNTGVETVGDTEVIQVDGLSIDTSTVDANGNTVYNYSNAYVSSKWWRDGLVFSTTDLNLTEIRFAQIAYEQFNDSPGITVNSFDAHYLISNTNAIMDAYLYSVVVVNNIATITNIASLNHLAGEFAGSSYRKRKGNLDIPIDGSTSGIFIDLYLKPISLEYFSNFTIKVWATKQETITVNFI